MSLFRRLALKWSSSIINTFCIVLLLFSFYDWQSHLKGILAGYELWLCLALQSVALLQVADAYAVRLYTLVVVVVGVYAIVLYDEHFALTAKRHMKLGIVLWIVVLNGILDDKLQAQREDAFVAVAVQIVGMQDDGVVVAHVEQTDVRLDEVGAVGKGYILLVDMLKYVAVDMRELHDIVLSHLRVLPYHSGKRTETVEHEMWV